MSFTLGNKEAIVNAAGQYTASAFGTNGLQIKNFGTFGDPDGTTGDITLSNIIAQAYHPATLGTGNLTCPDATAIGVVPVGGSPVVRQPVTVLIRVNTSRFSSEWAVDFIKRGRPFVFEISVDSGEGSASIADKLVKVLEDYETKFLVSDNKSGSLPFNWMLKDGADDIDLSLKAGDLSFGGTVTFMKKNETFGLNINMPSGGAGTYGWEPEEHLLTVGLGMLTIGPAVDSATLSYPAVDDGNIFFEAGGIVYTAGVTVGAPDIFGITQLYPAAPTVALVIGASYTYTVSSSVTGTGSFSGTEANVDGKYLEENVRMSTGDSVDGAYSIKPGERPVINAPYVMLSWESNAPIGGAGGWAGHKRLHTFAVDAETGSQVMKYSMYFNYPVFKGDGITVGTTIDPADLTGDGSAVLTWLLKAPKTAWATLADSVGPPVIEDKAWS